MLQVFVVYYKYKIHIVHEYLLCIMCIKFIKMFVVYYGYKVHITQYMLVMCNMYKFCMKCVSVV